MTSNLAVIDDVIPSATPVEADIRAWAALPRDEQLRRLRAALGRADCATDSAAAMSEILTEARTRADERRRG